MNLNSIHIPAFFLFIMGAKQLLTQNGLHHKSVQDWLELTRNYPTFPEIQKSIQQVTNVLNY